MLTAPQGGVLPQGGRRWPPPEQSRPHLPSPPGACSAHCLSVSWERTRPHSHRRSAPGRRLLLLFFSQCSGLFFFSPRCADLRATFKSRFPGVCSGKAPWAVTQETVTGKTGRTPGGGKPEAPRSLGPSVRAPRWEVALGVTQATYDAFRPWSVSQENGGDGTKGK